MNNHTVSLVLVLDTSGSMYGEKIESMKKAVHFLIAGLQDVRVNNKPIELAIVAYGKQARLVTSFSPVTSVDGAYLDLSAGGTSPLTEGLILAQELLKEKRTSGVVLFSDGIPDDIHYKRVAMEFLDRTHLFAVSIGYDVDEASLFSFTRDKNKIYAPWVAYTLGEILLREMLGEYVHEAIC